MDFSPEAELEMYMHESNGKPLTSERTNGFAMGKKIMDITVAAWKEDIYEMQLFVHELIEDGYPEWFLKKVQVLHLKATKQGYSKWFTSNQKGFA